MELIYKFLSKEDLVRITELSLKLANKDNAERSLRKALADMLPLEGFIACEVNTLQPDDGLARVMNLGYPAEWVARYNAHHYHRLDPVVMAPGEGLTHWRDLCKSGLSTPQEAFMQEAAEHGLNNGFSIRKLENGRMHIASFVGGEIDEHPRHTAVATLIAPHFHLAVKSSPRLTSTPRLSLREKDVIRWVASGKTNWEISLILKISERTVKFHLQNVMGKLQATTRTQAVAYAMNSGIL